MLLYHVYRVVYLLGSIHIYSAVNTGKYVEDIRLVPYPGSRIVSKPSAGRVEVKHSGVWGTICDDGWDNNDATVVCRQLGFIGGPSYAVGSGYSGQPFPVGSGQIWVAGVECSGLESSLNECQFPWPWGTTGACDHEEDAFVRCQGDQDIDECDSSPCQNGAECIARGIAVVDSYICQCLSGYSGTNCETDINECDPNPCQNGGECDDGVDFYRCQCRSGYSGTNCETVPTFTTGQIKWTTQRTTPTANEDFPSKHENPLELKDFVIIGAAGAVAMVFLVAIAILAIRYCCILPKPPKPAIDNSQEVVPDGNGSYLHKHIQPCYPTEHQLNLNTNYDMSSRVKGLAYVMHNQDFEGPLMRRGSDVDFKNIKHVFTELGYQLDTHVNLNGQAIRDTISAFSRRCSTGQFHSAAVIVMSHGGITEHGGKDFIYGIDMEEVLVDDIQEQLMGGRCPGMVGKPKLFIIQACRGAKRLSRPTNPSQPIQTVSSAVTDCQSDYLTRGHTEGTVVVTDAPPKISRKKTMNVPMNADMYFAFATPDGYVSLRHEIEGSWFIQAICEEFLSSAHRDSLDVMMTKVTKRVSAQKGKMYDIELQAQVTIQQLPERLTRMRKTLYFWPKYPGTTREEDNHASATRHNSTPV